MAATIYIFTCLRNKYINVQIYSLRLLNKFWVLKKRLPVSSHTDDAAPRFSSSHVGTRKVSLSPSFSLPASACEEHVGWRAGGFNQILPPFIKRPESQRIPGEILTLNSCLFTSNKQLCVLCVDKIWELAKLLG